MKTIREYPYRRRKTTKKAEIIFCYSGAKISDPPFSNSPSFFKYQHEQIKFVQCRDAYNHDPSLSTNKICYWIDS